MIKVAFLNITFLTSILFVGSIKSPAQFADVVPLTSSYEDVVRAHPGEQKLSDGSSRFDSEDYVVTIKYYYSGCSQAEEKKLGLTYKMVIQLNGVPKRERAVINVIGGYWDGFKRLEITANEIAYVNPKLGFIVTGRLLDDMPEMATAYFYVPKIKEMPQCLLQQLDPGARRPLEIMAAEDGATCDK